jgi:protein-S-isoprenylcysteine O-methyltransferase Ste14
VFVLIAIVGVISWAGFLVATRRKAPAQLRPVTRWVATSGLLVTCGVLLAEIANQQRWTLHRSALGVAVFLLPVSGLACLAIAAVTWRRRDGRRSA